MKKNISVYEGLVEPGRHSWDRDDSLYIDHDELYSVLSDLEGKRVRITIEELEEKECLQ